MVVCGGRIYSMILCDVDDGGGEKREVVISVALFKSFFLSVLVV